MKQAFNFLAILLIFSCAADSCAMQRLARKFARKQAAREDWRLIDRDNRDYCHKAATRGDVALVRTLLQQDAEKYLPYFKSADAAKGVTRMGKIAGALLKYKQRNGQLRGHFLDGDIQEDLNHLLCIAVIRADRQAVNMLRAAGADIGATMTTEFTDEQVRRVTDVYRNHWIAFPHNRYTPLLYLAGLLRVHSGRGKYGDGDNVEAQDLALVSELVHAGADFRRPTPSGRVPYEKACEQVQAEIDLITQGLRGVGAMGTQRAAQEWRDISSGRESKIGDGPEEDGQDEQDGEPAGPEDQGCMDQAQECFNRVKSHLGITWATGALILVVGALFECLG